MDKAGRSTTKRDKVFKNLDKSAFLDVLSGKRPSVQNAKSQSNEAKKPKMEVKDEVLDEPGSWSVLKDNFMLGAKMRDWDKENSDSD